MAEQKILYKIRVIGRVQGVGFRWSAVREAGRRGITGMVRNCPDGSVYLEAEGERERLDEFVEWCRKGPGPGYVKSVVYDVHPPSGYREFRVDY